MIVIPLLASHIDTTVLPDGTYELDKVTVCGSGG